MKFQLTIFLFTLFISFNSCSQNSTNEKLEKVEINYPDGTPKVRATTLNGKRHGTSKTYYKDGTIETENEWNQNLQHGLSKRWHPNGKLYFEGQYKDHKSDGEWKYYNRDNGNYIYSVYYKGGERINVKWSDTKYNWTPHSYENFGIDFEFPNYVVDSINQQNLIIQMYTMYPSFSKSDIEFYSISRTSNQIISIDFDSIMKGFSKDNLTNELSVLYAQASEDPTIPNILKDNYTLTPVKTKRSGKYKTYEFSLIYTDFDIELRQLIFKTEDYMYQVSAYFNNETPKEIRDRYFNSIKIQ